MRKNPCARIRSLCRNQERHVSQHGRSAVKTMLLRCGSIRPHRLTSPSASGELHWCYIVVGRRYRVHPPRISANLLTGCRAVYMDLTHIHLLLNHFPTIGVIIGGGLFLIALITKSNDLKHRQPGCAAGNRADLDPHLYERQWRAGRDQVSPGRTENHGRSPRERGIPGHCIHGIPRSVCLACVMAVPPPQPYPELESDRGARPDRGDLWPDGPRLQYRRRNSPRGNPCGGGGGSRAGTGAGNRNRRRNHRSVRWSGAYGWLLRYRNPMDVAHLRDSAFRRPDAPAGRGASGRSARSGNYQGCLLRLTAPPVATGRVWVRRQRHHRHVVLRRNTRPIHQQPGLLLENRAGDARRVKRGVLYSSQTNHGSWGRGTMHRLRPKSPLRRRCSSGLELCITEACCPLSATHSRRIRSECKRCHWWSGPFSW